MVDVSIKLITQEYVTDEVGNQILQNNEFEVPIIEVQDVYQSEFYNASQQGLKPTLRLLISDLNYNDEEELIYMNKHYSVIRVDRVNNNDTFDLDVEMSEQFFADDLSSISKVEKEISVVSAAEAAAIKETEEEKYQAEKKRPR